MERYKKLILKEMEGGIGKNNKRKTFRVPLNPFTKQPSKLEGYRV